METSHQLWRFTFFCISTFFLHTDSIELPPSPDDPSACILNLTSYPYQPTVDCKGLKEKKNKWNGFPSNPCCRNALSTLSRALALHANGTNSIFIPEDQWRNCSGPFRRQPSVSVQSCSFDDLFNGSSICSGLSLSTIIGTDEYKNATDSCSAFAAGSFDDACSTCVTAIAKARERLLNDFLVSKNDTERVICGVAIIVAVSVGKLNRSSADDFYSCLPALDLSKANYIKIKYSLIEAVLAILVGIIGLLMVVLLIKYVTKSTKAKPVEAKEISKWSGIYRFSKAEIEKAINFGLEKVCLGRGSAGQVYKGILPSGQVVAIKHIFKNNTSDSFSREVDQLSKVRHPNLVSLFGYCDEDGDQYLVYEYCSSGNLAQQLLNKDTGLTWERRVQILRDCAFALRHLHHHLGGCIVHRDIKLTNILMTRNMEPKLSDFGLAKMLNMEQSKVFTEVRGTIGYMDPEYISNAKLTCASDIYSFGIVILQILSGQKVFELDLDARDQLARKAKDVSLRRRPVTDFEDPRLNGNLNRQDFLSILEVAVLCVARSSKDRPSIDVVAEELEKAFRNTAMKAKRELSSSEDLQSRPFEVFPV